jgi:hypothetical protein
MWYILGFFVPIAGLIIFFMFLYKNPDLALKARRGVLHGFVIDCILLTVFYILVYVRGGV